MKPLVIIHGWSDNAESFIPLADAIQKKTNRDVAHIWLGNYVSLDDDVQMKDLIIGLTKAWKDKKLPQTPKGTDVIIHSTGGLVIRDWIATNYLSKKIKPPINNLVMLAPANFGSPLAHKGRAFYGRVVKGFNSNKRFETGTHILKALEMASPYTWELAEQDRFASNPFSATGVRTTVMVGNKGYGGISSLANEDGSDGTVYVSTANLNCAKVSVDFSVNPRNPKLKKQIYSKGESAFLVEDNHNHSSVAFKVDDHPDNKTLLNDIVKAVSIKNSNEFKKWITTCNRKTSKIMKKYSTDGDEYKHGFQNTVFRVKDDEGFEVDDYVIEFYTDYNKGIWDTVAELFNNKAVSNVHAYKDNPAYRSFMIDCTELYKIIDEEDEHLKISISAMPNLNEEKNLVGYRTFEDGDIGSITLSPSEIKKFFIPNRTLFVDVTLKRDQKKELFTIEKMDSLSLI